MLTLLKDVANIKIGSKLDKPKSKDMSSYPTYKLITLRSFNPDTTYNQDDFEDFIANEPIIISHHFARKEDVFLRLRAPNYAIYMDKDYENLIYSYLIACIRVDTKYFIPKFIAYYLNSKEAQKALNIDVSQTTIPMIKSADVARLKIPIINLEKQQKIVDYLDLAHKENMLLKSLITKKQQYQKAVFEKLISQGE